MSIYDLSEEQFKAKLRERARTAIGKSIPESDLDRLLPVICAARPFVLFPDSYTENDIKDLDIAIDPENLLRGLRSFGGLPPGMVLDTFSHLRAIGSHTLSAAKRVGDDYVIHANLVDNLASALSTLGAVFGVRAFRKEGDTMVELPQKPGTVSDLSLRAQRWLESARALWQLLDDIDTLSDQIKPNQMPDYVLFYRRALDLAEKRHEVLKSDGHKLSWPEDPIERNAKSNYTFEKIPEGDPLIYEKYEDLKLGIEAAVTGVPHDSHLGFHGSLLAPIRVMFDANHAALQKPIPMLLSCPMCHARHFDEGEFETKPHHSHACQAFVDVDGKRRRCGHVWRPALVPTVGVEALPGFVNDTGVTDG